MEILDYLILFISLIGSYFGVYYLTPMIIVSATKKQLLDVPNDRSSHIRTVPRLGGIGIFFALAIGIYLLERYDDTNSIITILTSLIILFLVGLKDDIVGVNARTKLVAQLICATLVFLHPGFQLTLLTGVFHDYLAPGINASPLVFLFIIALINAYNLIDGIDGLASLIAIIILSAFSVIYYIIGDYLFLGICLLGIGGIAGFLKFNVTKTKYKIFMGDTGSMVIGFIIALLTIKILSYNLDTFNQQPMPLRHIPYFILSVIFVPFYDTTRIIVVRLLKGQGVFTADQSHTHHLITKNYNLSHIKTSLIIGGFNVAMIILFFFLAVYANTIIILSTLALIITGLSVFFNILSKNIKNKEVVKP